VDAIVVSWVNNTMAQTVARARIAELRRESYDELRARVGQPETTKVVDAFVGE
jgi:hypothetical protein